MGEFKLLEFDSFIVFARFCSKIFKTFDAFQIKHLNDKNQNYKIWMKKNLGDVKNDKKEE